MHITLNEIIYFRGRIKKKKKRKKKKEMTILIYCGKICRYDVILSWKHNK